MDMTSVILAVVFVNGVYDVFCFLGIMWLRELPIVSTLHIGIFKEDELTPLTKRILAFWIFTYGVIRVLAGAFGHDNHVIYFAAELTYFIEVFAYEYELFAFNSVISYKVRMITLTSLSITAALLFFTPP